MDVVMSQPAHGPRPLAGLPVAVLVFGLLPSHPDRLKQRISRRAEIVRPVAKQTSMLRDRISVQFKRPDDPGEGDRGGYGGGH